MKQVIAADASPEKRLFISLITRDIPLVAAFLDLVDNSVNAAVEPAAARLMTANDYIEIFADPTVEATVNIALTVDAKRIEVKDTAGGISAATARDHVFKFGRSLAEAHGSDRLSVYGIGLKRAMFKLGNRISIRSDHVDGGFELKLDVAKWEKETTLPWTFEITSRDPVDAASTGTSIVVTDLYDETSRRIGDGVFVGELRDAISRTYAFYLAKFVSITVNDTPVDGVAIDIGSNHASEQFAVGDVTCAITAGLGVPRAGGFRERTSGWFVFCNGRAVVSADKSALTGWGGSGLPMFQPKHRPFLGTVFFVSYDAELLPWNTTKSGLNEDSAIWQEAKRYMVSVGRQVVTFLDGRYTDEGTEIPSKDLQTAAGNRQNIISAAAPERRAFEAPTRPPPVWTRIQYDAKISDLKLITNYLRKPYMSGADVGRHTFSHFLKNEVGEE
ncbi:ATP-binding protein [Mesorhizobium australicum]|uniref:ATP-binding protein n=1 Tax=Mesorhizobium australicum TaxID=536018 RepID=UPI00333CE980